MKRTVDFCSDHMPDKRELHLPYFQMHHVCDRFAADSTRLYDTFFQSYFTRVWRNYCYNIMRKKRRFTHCAICDERSKPQGGN